MKRFVFFLLLLPSCDPHKEPSEFECMNVCEAQVKKAEAQARADVQRAKDNCVREVPRKNSGGSKQLSSRSYGHPKDWDDMIVETKVRVWKHVSGKAQRIQCFYYEGERTDEYIKRDSTVVQVGAENPLDVTVIARLRRVPHSIRVGDQLIRTECSVLME
jgi:hypothetical protein